MLKAAAGSNMLIAAAGSNMLKAGMPQDQIQQDRCLRDMSTMYNISDVYQADPKPRSLMLKAGMPQDQIQQDRCLPKKFGLFPWPVGRLAFKDVGRAVRAA